MSRRIYSCRTILQFDQYLNSCKVYLSYRSDFPMGFAKCLTGAAAAFCYPLVFERHRYPLLRAWGNSCKNLILTDSAVPRPKYRAPEVVEECPGSIRPNEGKWWKQARLSPTFEEAQIACSNPNTMYASRSLLSTTMIGSSKHSGVLFYHPQFMGTTPCFIRARCISDWPS